MKQERSVLRGPFQPSDKFGWVANVPGGGDDAANPYRSQMCLFEDGTRLSQGHLPHWVIGRTGSGRYSHWDKRLFFSTSDGTNPNSNGRVYSFDYSLDKETWNRERLARSARRWDWHPRKNYFHSKGCDAVPPPLTCNLGLTNKCNLRCEICGSQKHLDETGVRRRHMSLKIFEAVAETIFPFLSLVELNSQGDPLLHPNIDTVLSRVAEHGCDIKLQHNGTLLSDKIVDLLTRQHGTVMLSLDAVGSKFDEVRRGGVWQKAEPGLIHLLAARDPRRLSVGVYPTLTRRTISEAIGVVEWSAENGADVVAFHRYVPVVTAWEEAPTDLEYENLKQELMLWSARNQDPVKILFESECLNLEEPTLVTREPASLEKAAVQAEFNSWNFPTEDDNPQADPFYSCTAPSDYVEIGLEGQIAVCCRSQDVPLGYATSVESFADTWLGANYNKIRASMKRGANDSYPLPNCEGCMKFFAPKLAGQRKAVEYAHGTKANNGLEFSANSDIRIEEIHKEIGHCYIAIIPLGLNTSDFDLWEDDRKLGPGDTLHDDIRHLGKGLYHIGARSVYFSTSDDSDAQRNQRVYALRPR